MAAGFQRFDGLFGVGEFGRGDADEVGLGLLKHLFESCGNLGAGILGNALIGGVPVGIEHGNKLAARMLAVGIAVRPAVAKAGDGAAYWFGHVGPPYRAGNRFSAAFG